MDVCTCTLSSYNWASTSCSAGVISAYSQMHHECNWWWLNTSHLSFATVAQSTAYTVPRKCVRMLRVFSQNCKFLCVCVSRFMEIDIQSGVKAFQAQSHGFYAQASTATRLQCYAHTALTVLAQNAIKIFNSVLRALLCVVNTTTMTTTTTHLL